MPKCDFITRMRAHTRRYRTKAFSSVSLLMLLRALLHRPGSSNGDLEEDEMIIRDPSSSPAVGGGGGGGSNGGVCGGTAELPRGRFHVYASPNNVGAADVARLLAAQAEALAAVGGRKSYKRGTSKRDLTGIVNLGRASQKKDRQGASAHVQRLTYQPNAGEEEATDGAQGAATAGGKSSGGGGCGTPHPLSLDPLPSATQPRGGGVSRPRLLVTTDPDERRRAARFLVLLNRDTHLSGDISSRLHDELEAALAEGTPLLLVQDQGSMSVPMHSPLQSVRKSLSHSRVPRCVWWCTGARAARRRRLWRRPV